MTYTVPKIVRYYKSHIWDGMETKETFSRTDTEKRLIQDSEYFKYVFKKTEKIACAVFYVVRSNKDISTSDTVVSEMEDAAQDLVDVSLESLRAVSLHAAEYAREVAYALLRLESKLRIAGSARVVGPDLLGVFFHEIDSVQRALRRYAEGDIANPMFDGTLPGREPARESRRLRPRAETPVGNSGSEMLGRRERVIAVIRDKGEASIKDIVEVVTDCSEKTIQRELNALIKDSVVQREGERRWSKYKLV